MSVFKYCLQAINLSNSHNCEICIKMRWHAAACPSLKNFKDEITSECCKNSFRLM